MKKVLFVCTSNRDRSPSLERYFAEHYPQHEYRSAGINVYLTKRKGTHLITDDDLEWATLVVFAELIHQIITEKRHKEAMENKPHLVLALGDYEQCDVGMPYLQKAASILDEHLK